MSCRVVSCRGFVVFLVALVHLTGWPLDATALAARPMGPLRGRRLTCHHNGTLVIGAPYSGTMALCTKRMR